MPRVTEALDRVRGGRGASRRAAIRARDGRRPVTSLAHRSVPQVRERLLAHASGNPLALLEIAGRWLPGELAGRRPLSGPLPLSPGLAWRRPSSSRSAGSGVAGSVGSLVWPGAAAAGDGPPSADGAGRLAQWRQPGQLGAGGDAELGEDLVQVVLDGPRADEKLSRDLPVGRPGGGQPSDLQLLGGELGERGGIPAPGGLAAGAQFGPGAAGPPGRA